MNIRFEDRNFPKPLVFPGVAFQVERCSWDIDGGPSKAEVLVAGPAARLWGLLQLLRCPAMITDDFGAPAWWGYVHEVDVFPGINAGASKSKEALSFSVSLDELYTSTAVRYRDARPSEAVNYGWQFQTAWQSDSRAAAEWGKKQGIFSLPVSLASEAAAFALTQLARYKLPQLKARGGQRSAFSGFTPTRGGGMPEKPIAFARLKLRGWWDTLGWCYFSEARGLIGQLSGGGATQNFGDAAATSQVAQSFTLGASGWTTAEAWMKGSKFGTPGDNYRLDVLNDSGGAPGGVSIGASTLIGSGFTGDTLWTGWQISASLAANTTYWLRLACSGANDANNYYRVSVDQGLPFAGGSLKIWNGSSWVARVPDADMLFAVVGTAASTAQIATACDPGNANGGGQFLKGAFIKDASGVSTRLYRGGSQKALDEVKALLDLGDSAGNRLIAQVTPERWLVVRKLPPSTVVDYQMTPAGEIRQQAGGAFAPGQGLVGHWARVQGMEQAGGDVSIPKAVLITRAEWSASTGVGDTPTGVGDTSTGVGAGGVLRAFWE